MQRYTINILFVLSAVFLVCAAQTERLDSYILTVVMTMGINIIFASSLNLVNGYMGEFSCGHGGFMCVGAYVGSVLSVIFFTTNKLCGAPLFSPDLAPFLFPLILAGAGFVSALFGLIVALPSFHTRGDYLAIITIAANYIIISIIENIDVIGGARGVSGLNCMSRIRIRGRITHFQIWLNSKLSGSTLTACSASFSAGMANRSPSTSRVKTTAARMTPERDPMPPR